MAMDVGELESDGSFQSEQEDDSDLEGCLGFITISVLSTVEGIELQVALEKGLIKPGLVSKIRTVDKRPLVNNVRPFGTTWILEGGLKSALERVSKAELGWAERLDVAVNPAPEAAPGDPSTTSFANIQEDDFKRELVFYRQVITDVALERVSKAELGWAERLDVAVDPAPEAAPGDPSTTSFANIQEDDFKRELVFYRQVITDVALERVSKAELGWAERLDVAVDPAPEAAPGDPSTTSFANIQEDDFKRELVFYRQVITDVALERVSKAELGWAERLDVAVDPAPEAAPGDPSTTSFANIQEDDFKRELVFYRQVITDVALERVSKAELGWAERLDVAVDPAPEAAPGDPSTTSFANIQEDDFKRELVFYRQVITDVALERVSKAELGWAERLDVAVDPAPEAAPGDPSTTSFANIQEDDFKRELVFYRQVITDVALERVSKAELGWAERLDVAVDPAPEAAPGDPSTTSFANIQEDDFKRELVFYRQVITDVALERVSKAELGWAERLDVAVDPAPEAAPGDPSTTSFANIQEDDFKRELVFYRQVITDVALERVSKAELGWAERLDVAVDPAPEAAPGDPSTTSFANIQEDDFKRELVFYRQVITDVALERVSKAELGWAERLDVAVDPAPEAAPGDPSTTSFANIQEDDFKRELVFYRQVITDVALERVSKAELGWAERLDVAVDPAPEAAPGDPSTTFFANIQEDDFKRELVFYRQAQEAVRLGIARLQKLGVPTRRPDNYYAQMAKSDKHMTKVREKLVDIQAAKKKWEAARRIREERKYASKVQKEVLLNRVSEKRKLAEAVKKHRKGIKDQLEDVLENRKADPESAGPKKPGKKGVKGSKKRAFKNSKFGFGGRKKGTKGNDATSFGAVPGLGASSKSGGRKAGASKKRPGKSKRKGGKKK